MFRQRGIVHPQSARLIDVRVLSHLTEVGFAVSFLSQNNLDVNVQRTDNERLNERVYGHLAYYSQTP